MEELKELTAIGDWILIETEKDAEQVKTAGGIIVDAKHVQSGAKKWKEGVIVSITDSVSEESGLAVGDRIRYDQYSATHLDRMHKDDEVRVFAVKVAGIYCKVS
jgi:co-chaperonin GroES (HSP10)